VFVAFGIQHAMRVRHLPSVASPALNIAPYYLINDNIKKNVEHRVCVLIFTTNFVWNVSHCKKNFARYDKQRTLVFTWSTCFSCQILIKLEFFDRFSKNTQLLLFIEIRLVGSELFHADCINFLQKLKKKWKYIKDTLQKIYKIEEEENNAAKVVIWITETIDTQHLKIHRYLFKYIL